MADVNMPKLSDTMEEGSIVEWKKSSGDEVHKGDVLAEVESDKATFDLEAETDGKLEILVEKGVPAKVGAPIARIGAGGGEPAAPAPKPEKKPAAKPAKAEEPTEKPAAAEAPEPEKAAPTPAPAEQPSQGNNGQAARVEIKASPLAKRMAEEMGVDLRAISGSGPDGRIVKEDVIAAAGNARPERRRAPAPAAPAGPDVEIVEPTRMQATIAKRMLEAKQTVPNFNVTAEARVDEAVKLRQQLK